MISVSLCREISFLAKGTNSKIRAEISSPSLKHSISLVAEGNYINVSYNQFLIWTEKILVPESNFGIESIQTILRIMFLIDKGDSSYKQFVFTEN